MAKTNLKKNKQKNWVSFKYKAQLKINPIDSEKIVNEMYRKLLKEMKDKIDKSRVEYEAYQSELKHEIMQETDLPRGVLDTSEVIEKYEDLLMQEKKD